MQIELDDDGTAHLYDESGKHVGHFADEASAKKWSKETYDRDGIVKKKDVKKKNEDA